MENAIGIIEYSCPKTGERERVPVNSKFWEGVYPRPEDISWYLISNGYLEFTHVHYVRNQ